MPRWLLRAAGAFLAAVSLLCLWGAIATIGLPSPAPLSFTIPILVGLIGGSLWGLAKSIRLLMGRPTHGGLIGPIGLQVIAWFFLAIPVVIITVGIMQRGPRPFIERPVYVAVRLLLFVGIFFTLRRLAASRQRGTCDCSLPPRDDIHRLACELIQWHIAEWTPRLPADLRAFPQHVLEERAIAGHRALFGLQRLELETGGALIVFQVFVYTWKAPSLVSIQRVGRTYAEGLMIDPEGTVRPAPRDIMSAFR
jgi:hypothetical protein